MDILILVCVGASEWHFDRLLKAIDDMCDEHIINGKDVIAQIGSSEYKPKNYTFFALIGRDKFQSYLERSTLIITHAGTGSVLPPLKMGKKIIVFPRREKYKEHLDDHQLELAEIFTSEGYTMCATNNEELKECILKSNDFIPRNFKSNSEAFNDLIINYIDNL